MTKQALGIGACCGLGLLFVTSLYVWNIFDPSLAKRSRDDPKVMKRRMISVVASTVCALVFVRFYTGHAFSLAWKSFPSIVLTITQTCLLMLGPIVHQLPLILRRRPILMILRNLVVAPICEEIVFRACFLQILVSSGFTSLMSAIIAPVIFAFSHAHHYSGKPLLSIILSIAHTCVFGWVAFYFLIRGSVWDAIVSHMLCNAIGLPYERSRTLEGRSLMVVYITGLVLFIISTR